MILAYGVLVPLFVASVWMFFSTSPRAATSARVMLYNAATIVAAVIGSGSYVAWLYIEMSHGSDFGWWPVISFLGALVISIGVLWISALIRNLVIFRKRNAR